MREVNSLFFEIYFTRHLSSVPGPSIFTGAYKSANTGTAFVPPEWAVNASNVSYLPGTKRVCPLPGRFPMGCEHRKSRGDEVLPPAGGQSTLSS